MLGTKLNTTRIWVKREKMLQTHTHTHRPWTTRSKRQKQKQKAQISENKHKPNKQSYFIKKHCGAMQCIAVNVFVYTAFGATFECVLAYILVQFTMWCFIPTYIITRSPTCLLIKCSHKFSLLRTHKKKPYTHTHTQHIERIFVVVNKNMKIDPIQRTGTKAENENERPTKRTNERCALKKRAG